MYKLITIDFNGIETEQAHGNAVDSIKRIYESYIKHCLYGFPDISEIQILKDGETVTRFINWRR